MPNLKGGILYSRCPCIETRHLARQVGGASAGFVNVRRDGKLVVVSFGVYVRLLFLENKIVVKLFFFWLTVYVKLVGRNKNCF